CCVILVSGGVRIDDVTKNERVEQREDLVCRREEQCKHYVRRVLPQVSVQNIHQSLRPFSASVNSRVGRRPLCYLAPRRRRESHSASKKRPSADASNHNDIDLAFDVSDVVVCDAGPSASTSLVTRALSLITGPARTTGA